ncbi:D-inositol-3-phosphate glycosyltransferase [Allonocardiopsis opalescens]|uniref:D-inositol-3-phosphate glycosyltransferase n=1 Tax=Allonocardiopsis opalescens TaxID=1144618 RepID=A0A2T0QA45_9ACTN|nr:D-inositol-3-phosphate glycosyltransferase [Allonocardiopsis opalescens]PRY00734.1 D-inositol-3-phosphate glycosyltransferase [Allonocardiopsis opalescens]
MVSLHTSPLEQPGGGDAGGMNVYVMQTARRLAERGVAVDVFTRATSAAQPPAVAAAPGVTVRHIPAGPFGPLAKERLPAQLCPFTFGVLRAEAEHAPGHYDLVHSHYWLSGKAAAVCRQRWGVPLVHSMHTLARVKNAALPEGEPPEPDLRLRGETQVVEAADRLIANTAEEAGQLVRLYGAAPGAVRTVAPGVDLDVFGPGSARAARDRLGLRPGDVVLLFVGRVQRLKAPDVLVRAAARLAAADPALRERLVVAVVGGLSGGSDAVGPARLRRLARQAGIGDRIRLEPPCRQERLADWYRAATATVVPSYSESFGLVAVESQACGTPVVAAAVGGLATAVRDGVSGVLVPGHEPERYAAVLRRLVENPDWRDRLGRAGRRHAAGFGWSRTVDGLMDAYTELLAPARLRPAVNR